MNSKPLLFPVFLLSICWITACNKNNDDPQQPGNRTYEDSVATLRVKWKVIKDSIVNVGDYFFEEGGTKYYPIPGVYTGVEADYWEFRANDSVYIHVNNNSYKSRYTFLANNTLDIKDMGVLGVGTIATLTETEAIFNWSATSRNGGRYYKRVYLKR